MIAVDSSRKLRVGMGGTSRVVVSESLTGSTRWSLVLSEGSVQLWAFESPE
jgi:hypothetical protein